MPEEIGLLGGHHLLGTRYPLSLRAGERLVRVRPTTASELEADRVVAVAVEQALPEEVARSLASGKPLLLGMEPLVGYLEAGGDRSVLSQSRWFPFLPVGLGDDVALASRLIAGGAIGAVSSCEVTTAVGHLRDLDWDCDTAFATSALEAVIFGLDLLSRLVGEVRATKQVYADPSGRATYLHFLDSGVATQHVLVVAAPPSPLFGVSVNGSQGRLLLRQPFARGAVTIWDGERAAYRSPALGRRKPNVQSPDTVLGGHEVRRLLQGLLASDASGLPSAEYGLSLVDHVLTAIGEEV